MKRVLLILFLSACFAFGEDNFEKAIRPLIVNNCYECHSSKAKRVKGDTLLDSKEGIQKALKDNVLLNAIVSGDMPPKKDLGEVNRNILASWIKNGAKLPNHFTVSGSRWGKEVESHWAFKKAYTPTVPDFKQENPIDNFIAEGLKERGVHFSPEAPKRELIRRLYFDMTGLPPTPLQVSEFEIAGKDYYKIVDEILSSRAYAERWARHWLDVARYSDYKGGANNRRDDPRYVYAWAYRDYVIDSFHEDKPYNRFIQEQIAGDLLPKPDTGGLGFITIGRRDNNANDVIDDRIDVITKGFLSMTVTCARCHDHKFDPISQKDYYALHGIFRSVSEPNEFELPMVEDTTGSNGFNEYIAKKKKLASDIQVYKRNEYSRWYDHFRKGSIQYIVHTHNYYNEVPNEAKGQYSRTNKVDNVTGLVGRMMSNWNREMNSKDDFWKPYQIVKVSKSVKKSEEEIRKIDEVILRGLRLAKAETPVQVAAWYGRLFYETYEKKINKKPLSPLQKKADKILFKDKGPCDLGDIENFWRILNNRERTQYQRGLQRVTAKLIDHEWASSVTPPRSMVITENRPVTSRIFLLGNARKLGDPAPRSFIEYLDPDGGKYPDKTSGRLELANSIIEHPLSTRSFVNRIWMHHFGRGFVDTPDDLGIQAEDPSHPELLEFLSNYLRENNWSIKRLHRLIVTSRTYRQSSKADGKMELKDPGNIFLHRQNIRRLEFEAIRDSLFFFANGGNFEKAHGGPVKLFNSPYPNSRSIFGEIDRRRLPEILSNFDMADPNLPTGKRFRSSIPQQSLFMLNNSMMMVKVKEIASRFDKVIDEPGKIQAIYQLLLQRNPTDMETKLALKFIQSTPQGTYSPFEQFIHVMVMSNESMYIN